MFYDDRCVVITVLSALLFFPTESYIDIHAVAVHFECENVERPSLGS